MVSFYLYSSVNNIYTVSDTVNQGLSSHFCHMSEQAQE